MDTREMSDYAEYVIAWRARLVDRERRRDERVLRLRQAARDCARCLVRDFGAKKVYLFGSLLDGSLVHNRSDIDLAVEGLDGGAYFKALRDLGTLLPDGIELDLVPLEDAWPELAERVRMEGALLDVAP